MRTRRGLLRPHQEEGCGHLSKAAQFSVPLQSQVGGGGGALATSQALFMEPEIVTSLKRGNRSEGRALLSQQTSSVLQGWRVVLGESYSGALRCAAGQWALHSPHSCWDHLPCCGTASCSCPRTFWGPPLGGLEEVSSGARPVPAACGTGERPVLSSIHGEWGLSTSRNRQTGRPVGKMVQPNLPKLETCLRP